MTCLYFHLTGVATAPAAIAPTATATAAPLAPVSLRAATEKDRSIDGKLTSQFASFPCVLHVTRDRLSAVQKVHRCIQREEEQEDEEEDDQDGV